MGFERKRQRRESLLARLWIFFAFERAHPGVRGGVLAAGERANIE